MNRSFIIALLAVFMFIPTIQAAEPYESTACKSGTMTIIHSSAELTVMSFELKGIIRGNTDSEILNNASEWCVGILRQMGNELTQNGYCKHLYPNGDIHIVEFGGNLSGGEWEFLLGTGKWEGIKGGGSWSYLQRAKPIAPGTFHNCTISKGTYELPE